MNMARNLPITTPVTRLPDKRTDRRISVVIACTVLTLLVTGGPARAQSGNTVLGPPGAAPPPEPPAPAELVSPNTALGLSLLGTASIFGLAYIGEESDTDAVAFLSLAALLAGPSLGQFYAGNSRGACTGFGLRATGVGLMVTGALISLNQCFLQDCDGSPGLSLIVVGGAVIVGATIYSIVDAPRAARRTNRRRRQATVLAPGPVIGPSRTAGLGLHLRTEF